MDKAIAKNINAGQIIRSLLVSYVLTGGLLLVLAMVMYRMELDESRVTIGIIGIYIISCLIGGLILGKCVHSRKFIWGLGLGILYFVILTVISLAVNRELSGDITSLITTFVMCAAGGMLGGMIA